MKLSKVLLIDDKVDQFDGVIQELNEAEIQVVPLDGSEALDEFLESSEPFDAVILDWNFGEGSETAQVCLKKIRQNRFVPVLVWTEEQETFEIDLPKITFFPHSCIQGVSKADVTSTTVVERVNTWFKGSTAASLSDEWRSSTARATEKSLYELAELDDKDVIRALRVFVKAGEPADSMDLDHAVEVLGRLLQRELLVDKNLSGFLQEKLRAIDANQVKDKTPSRVQRLHMYYQPEDDFVRTGDIVKLKYGEQDKVALVATPSCDLAQPKTEYLRLIVVGAPWDGKNQAPQDRCKLPFLQKENNVFENKEARFQETISLKNLELAEGKDYRERKSVMRYTHKYQSLGGQNASIKRFARVNDPYRSDLLQRFAAHASRVGTPDFKE